MFFGIFCAISFGFVYLCVPETSGRSLEEMDEVFGDTTATTDGERKHLVLRKVRQEKKTCSAAVTACALDAEPAA